MGRPFFTIFGNYSQGRVPNRRSAVGFYPQVAKYGGMFGVACLKTDRFGRVFWESHELFPKLRKYVGIAVEVGMRLYTGCDYIDIKRAVPV